MSITMFLSARNIKSSVSTEKISPFAPIKQQPLFYKKAMVAVFNLSDIYLMHASNRTNEMELVGKFDNKRFADLVSSKIITEMPKGQHYKIENKYDQRKVFYDENIIEIFKTIEIPDNEFCVAHYDDLNTNIEMCFGTTFPTLGDAANALSEEIESTNYYPTFEEKDNDDNILYGEYEDKEEYIHIYKVIGK